MKNSNLGAPIEAGKLNGWAEVYPAIEVEKTIIALEERIAELENFLEVARIPDAQEWLRQQLKRVDDE